MSLGAMQVLVREDEGEGLREFTFFVAGDLHIRRGDSELIECSKEWRGCTSLVDLVSNVVSITHLNIMT